MRHYLVSLFLLLSYANAFEGFYHKFRLFRENGSTANHSIYIERDDYGHLNHSSSNSTHLVGYGAEIGGGFGFVFLQNLYASLEANVGYSLASGKSSSHSSGSFTSAHHVNAVKKGFSYGMAASLGRIIEENLLVGLRVGLFASHIHFDINHEFWGRSQNIQHKKNIYHPLFGAFIEYKFLKILKRTYVLGAGYDHHFSQNTRTQAGNHSLMFSPTHDKVGVYLKIII